ncbi:MAG: hypothetical protein L6R41_005436 [Letrouitia leprolyta]|nr:MAG: hypothetical protein L6R41_005436 [Letrouitia leprolyta]
MVRDMVNFALTSTPFNREAAISFFSTSNTLIIEEAQTQSEPAADREKEGQHGDNSIAASSAPEESQFTDESNASRIPEAASEAPINEQPPESEPLQNEPGQDEQPRTLGELASAATSKVRETASNAFGAFSGQETASGGQRDSAFSKPAPAPSETVYVGNLFFDVREDDIRREFEKIGPIEQIKLIMDNRGLSKGFGYVTFTNVASAQTAVSTLNAQVFEGRRLTVAFAHQRTPPVRSERASRMGRSDPSRTLFIGNMSFEISDRELNNLFREIRNVTDVRVAIDRRTGQPRGFAHADFTDIESAKAAMVELSGKEVCGRELRVDFGRAPSTPGRGQEGRDDQQGY